MNTYFKETPNDIFVSDDKDDILPSSHESQDS